MDEYIKWLNEEAPKINSYQYKEWDQETIDKVNKNLATYTSSYSAPRPTVAAVNEAVKEIIENQNSGDSKPEPEAKAEEPAEAETIICISEVTDISPCNLDCSLCFIQSAISHDVFCIKVK